MKPGRVSNQTSRQSADVPLSHGQPHYAQTEKNTKKKAKNKRAVTERGKNVFTVGAGQEVSVSQDTAVKQKKKKKEKSSS